MSESLFLLVLRLLYGSVSALGLIGYVPTIKSLLAGDDCANRSSYLIWTISSIISTLYAVVIINDWLLILASSINLFFCLLIYILTYNNIRKAVAKIF